MYCSECGKKVEKEDLYCGECGAKIERKKQKVQFKKTMSVKTKKKMLFITIIMLIVGLTFWRVSSISSPKSIAKKYVSALASQNYNKLYQYLELGNDHTFTNKKVFNQLMKENSQTQIQNYKITTAKYHDSDKALVTFSYQEKGDSIKKTMNISLTKQKEKKWLFFDQWKISSSETKQLVVEDFKLIVPKDSKVTYAGVKVDKRYLNQKESTDTTDVYILKQVFACETMIEIELPNSYQIKDYVTPSTYRHRYSANISLSTISKEEQTKITDTIKSDLTTIYEYAIQNKTYEELKKKLKLTDHSVENMESTYTKLVSNLKSAYNVLTAINFTNITLSDAKLNENGYLEFNVKASYKYTIKYVDFTRKEQTKEASSYSYMTISYNVKDGDYYIVNADHLEDYFSRY